MAPGSRSASSAGSRGSLPPIPPGSPSAVGFLAPADTPLLWLLGLALFMQRLFWRSPDRWWLCLAMALGFLGAHLSHVAIAFSRLTHASGG